MPERCSRLMMLLSRQITWIELKNPFQMETQVRASAPFKVPSIVIKKSPRTTRLTMPAMIAAIGSTFQSF